MNICYFGTYEENYSRNEIMIKALRALGHTVKECHVSLWKDKIHKTETMLGAKSKIGFVLRLLSLYPRLFTKYLFIGSHDVIFVGYFGHLDMIVLKIFTLLLFRRKKIVFDVFLSLYDSMIIDRKMASDTSFLSRVTRWLDTNACRFADVVILDTNQHIEFFHDSFGVPRRKMIRVYASADQDIFYPRHTRKENTTFNVLFYGKYIPLHGIEHIVGAAEILSNDPAIRFTFIGKGQLYSEIRRMVSEGGLSNIDFIEWVKYEDLPIYIEQADVCLGIFSSSEKAARVIPNKVFQSMAMGKAVVTGRTPGSEEGLVNQMNVLLCNVADPVDIARAIRTLKEDKGLRERLAVNARKSFETIFGDQSVQLSLKTLLAGIAK